MAGANIGMMVCRLPLDRACFCDGGPPSGMACPPLPPPPVPQDPAFFTGRKLIIQWLNDTFHMNVSKIEETASGESGV